MSQSTLGLSARSYLIAGVSAAVVGAAVVSPASVPALNPAKSAAAAVDLAAVTTPLENAIKNTYNFVEPWVAYGFELGQWVLSFIPGVWWLAPAIDLGYFTIEPLVQSGVFVIADLIGLDFAQIWPDITAGITGSINNAVDYALAWLGSLVPLPPFPPFPPRPFAAAGAASAEAAGLLAVPSANSITTPIENAIKNSYNFLEGWTDYGMEWASYALGRIPVVNWFTPAIPLVYNTIEPLVRAGVFSIADLIGFNWGAIGPELWNGITTSVNNAIEGVLNWINIPVPPIPPLREAAAAAGVANLRAAAAQPAAATVVTTVDAAPATETPAAAGDNAAPQVETPKADAPKADAAEVSVAELAPAVEAPVVAVEATTEAEAAQPTRTARRGHSAPVSAAAADDSGAGSVRAERPSRASRGHSNAR